MWIKACFTNFGQFGGSIQLCSKCKSLLAYVILLFVFCFFHLKPIYASIRYPISELGNCRNTQECRLYCQIPQNTPACWSYKQYIKATNVLGVTTSQTSNVKFKNIRFPVAELGNCASVSECKTYCAEEKNRQSCASFAKIKGLASKAETENVKINNVIRYAKKELNCDSRGTCLSLCAKEENREKCRLFTEKYHLGKTQKAGNVISKQIIANAKSELNCTDIDTCRNLCEQQENKQSCLRFARKHQIANENIDQVPSSPSAAILPCAKDTGCVSYCRENPADCKGYNEYLHNQQNQNQRMNLTSQTRISTTSPTINTGDFIGPSGCKTEEECQSYCEKHPNDCPSFPKVTPTSPVRQTTPSSSGPPSLFREEVPTNRNIQPTMLPLFGTDGG